MSRIDETSMTPLAAACGMGRIFRFIDAGSHFRDRL